MNSLLENLASECAIGRGWDTSPTDIKEKLEFACTTASVT